MSMKIRDRVAREKHQQLRNIEAVKKKELLSWKEKHVNNTMADYYYCLSNVGDAHVAAERENELTEQLNEQESEKREIAAMRGRQALQKERSKNVKKNIVKRKPKANLVHRNVLSASPQVRDIENNKILSEDDENVLIESDDELITGNSIQKDVAQFSHVSDLIEERRKARKLCDEILESNLGASETEAFSKSPKSPQKPLDAPKAHEAPKSLRDKPLYAPKSPVAARGFVPKSNKFTRVDKATSGSQNINSQRNVATNTKKVNTPKKVVKPKNSVKSPKFASPQRRDFVPRFTKTPIEKHGILKNKTTPVITTATESPEKVQFYDHFSRYGKEYDALPGMVIRESHPPAVNANEAAKVRNEMDAIRFQQLQELRQKSEQRSKESLQKNQVRKDYENLTKVLDEMCKEEDRLRTLAMPNEQFSEERINQLARNRQESMNRAFEDIYHKPVVITCPTNSSSSDVNVATSPSPDTKQQLIDPFDSSDSCTSILIGYVDNRSRKLVKDIKQCKDDSDGEKRKKLVTLLTRLGHLRKLLMEEIVRNSSLNLEPFYRSVLEVETEKKEILFDPGANKENMKKRAEQKMKSDQKIGELFRKEQDKAIQTKDDNTFESVTSGTITSAVDQSEPLKILIEVKNAGKVRASRYPKKVHIASSDAGRESQHKTSVGSSSTAYRSPPRTFQTDFTKVLSNQAIAKPTKTSTKATTTKSVQQTPLAHYITRLLGMSQQSIDQLGVSNSSSIATPTDSVIEVPENLSSAVIDRNHLNRIQKKIDENLRFSKEVDDSFKQLKNQAEVKSATKSICDSKEQETKLIHESHVHTKEQAKNRQGVAGNVRFKHRNLSQLKSILVYVGYLLYIYLSTHTQKF